MTKLVQGPPVVRPKLGRVGDAGVGQTRAMGFELAEPPVFLGHQEFGHVDGQGPQRAAASAGLSSSDSSLAGAHDVTSLGIA